MNDQLPLATHLLLGRAGKGSATANSAQPAIESVISCLQVARATTEQRCPTLTIRDSRHFGKAGPDETHINRESNHQSLIRLSW